MSPFFCARQDQNLFFTNSNSAELTIRQLNASGK